MACIQRIQKLFNINLVQKRAFAVVAHAAHHEEVTIEHLRDTKHGVTVLNLNRIKQKNALSKNLVTHIEDAITTVSNHVPRVLIIRSTVPGSFCAGADLKERLKMSESEVSQYSNRLRGLMTRIHYLPFPVIAAIDGFALGGGLEMALACDIRVASSNAKLGLVETKLAIIPGAGGTARLSRLVGLALAKELIMTARVFDGNEAKDLGVVSHAVEQNKDGDAAYQKSIEIAKEILPNGPIGVKLAKFAVNRGYEVDINSALAFEETCYAQLLPTKDRIEGLQAFVEKRPPKYTGS